MTLFLANIPVAKVDLLVLIKNKIQQKYNSLRGKNEFLYTLQVNIGPQSYKITKTLQCFKDFERLVLNELIISNNDPNQPIKRSLIGGNSMISLTDLEEHDISCAINHLQQFMNNLIQNADYLVRIQIMTFLDVKEPEKTYFINLSPKIDIKADHKPSPEFGLFQYDLSFTKKAKTKEEISDLDDDDLDNNNLDDSFLAIEEEKSGFKTSAEDSEAFPYFEVKITKTRRPPHDDYLEYFIQIRIAEMPDNKWEIIKRYTDFRILHKTIKKNCVISPPHLPTKLMYHDEDQLKKRILGLEIYLKAILNEKIYLQVPAVFEFINQNQEDFQWLQEENNSSYLYFKARIIKTEIDINKKKPTTYYQIKINEMSGFNLQIPKNSKSFRKTFKDFENLDKGLQIRFQNRSEISHKLPTLPPKHNEFLNKTSINFRLAGLEKYLNELFKYPKIGDSFVFRKFIGVLPVKMLSLDEFGASEVSIPIVQQYAYSQPLKTETSPSNLDSSKKLEIFNSPNSFGNIFMKKKYRD